MTMTAPVQELSPRRMDLCDRHLEAVVRDMVGYDERLRGLDLRVEFRGGVAHLTGEVADAAELRTARGLIGGLAGVLAVWDRVRVAGREPRIQDVGCGGTKQYTGYVGGDVRAVPGVDVVAGVGGGVPFDDASFVRVFAVHVLEHLADFLPLVDECRRVLRPGGILHVLSPWWRYVNAVADPTHLRLLDVQTFKGICARDPAWYPLHAGCDGASIFADLENRGSPVTPDPEHLARFFD
ncbi:BON domain-containing protein [Nocardia farcinica]|uniref:BON domain-containing protein n=1 Tax=Nocardia farcinica TaxID=37329 RepID=UPI00313D66BF